MARHLHIHLHDEIRHDPHAGQFARGNIGSSSGTPQNFWSYQAGSPTPRVEELPEGVFKGTKNDWESLSPGMRREIARQAQRVKRDAKRRDGIVSGANRTARSSL